MASGIVSIDLYSDHRPVLSAITLWFAAGVWLLLAVVLGMRLAYQRDRFAREASSPAAFTGVAGTAVLGTWLAIHNYHTAAAALLVVAGVCWAVLVVPVLRHWKTPTAGASFVLTVAIEGLAVLGATLAVSYRAGWLVSAAAAALVLGLAFYVFTAARFDLRELVTGHGDHRVAGGALAISALAAGHLTQAAAALGRFSGHHQALTTSTLVLWWLAMVWLLPLVIGEILRPRLGYDPRRWATVFPLGMYAACSFTTGQVTGITGITGFGHAWTWSRSPAGCSRSPGWSVTAGRCCVVSSGQPLLRTGRRPRGLLCGTGTRPNGNRLELVGELGRHWVLRGVHRRLKRQHRQLGQRQGRADQHQAGDALRVEFCYTPGGEAAPRVADLASATDRRRRVERRSASASPIAVG